MLDDVPLEQWRAGRLVGTPDELAEQIAGWAALGVAELIVSAGPLPFSVSGLDDLGTPEPGRAAALTGGPVTWVNGIRGVPSPGVTSS